MTRLQLFFLSFAGLLAPAAFAFAQTKPKITIILEQMIRTTNGIVWLLVTLATVIFFWGLVKYITASESPEEQKKSRGLMLWGFIGLTVVLGFWGIIHILAVYFGVSKGSVQFFFPSPQLITNPRETGISGSDPCLSPLSFGYAKEQCGKVQSTSPNPFK